MVIPDSNPFIELRICALNLVFYNILSYYVAFDYLKLEILTVLTLTLEVNQRHNRWELGVEKD